MTAPAAPVDELGSARSFLFVPGDRPDRYAKAAASGADEVVCDLEDAVADAAKPDARRRTVAWLDDGGAACVRVNAAGTPWHLDDLEAVGRAAGLRGVVVPKAEDPEALALVAAALPAGVPLVALVETARGLLCAGELTAVPSVVRLAFGSIDFSLDISAQDDRSALLFARSSLVVAARAAGGPPPVDGVTTALDDPDALAEACAHAVSLGFGGKLCIHPRQVEAVHRAFSPTAEQVAWARRVLEAAGDGRAAAVDGHMVDRPVLAKADAVLRSTRSPVR